MECKILSEQEAKEVFHNVVLGYGKVADELIEEVSLDVSEEEQSKIRQAIISIQNAYNIFNVDVDNALRDIKSILSDGGIADFYKFVRRNKKNIQQYKNTIDETIKEGLEIRQEEGFVYPEVFKDSQTVLVSIGNVYTSKKMMKDAFLDINEHLTKKIVLKDDKFIVYEDMNGKEKEEKKHDFFSSRNKTLEKVIKDFEEIDFSDEELFKFFEEGKYKEIAGLYKTRGQNRDFSNKTVRALFSDEILFAHIKSEIKNYQQGSYEDKFMSSLQDLSEKYERIAKNIHYADSRNVAEEDEKTANIIVLSIHPYNIATMSTYQDWESCMHASGSNWEYIKEDIGRGTIVAYLVDEKNPQKRMSRIAMKPYKNENNDEEVLYGFSRIYGEQISDFEEVLGKIQEELLLKNKPKGKYVLDENLYTDGLIKSKLVYKDLEELLDILEIEYEKKEDGKLYIKDDFLDLSNLGLKGSLDLSNVVVSKIDCSDNQLTSLVLPEGCEYVRCSNNQLTSLAVPKGCKEVRCSNNQLTSLVVPKGCKEVRCSDNQLTSLKLPEGCKEVRCSYNQLTSLEIPEDCKDVDCSGNQLTSLALPEGCENVNCSGNQLTSLEIPKGCSEVNCSDNQLTNLELPEGCENVNCSNNQLTSLEVPEGCKDVNCYNNQLTSLEISEGCKSVSCSDNQLTSLEIPKGCKIVSCSNNQLTSLELLEGCDYVNCSNNQLTSLEIPEGCKEVNCYNNQLTSLALPEGCKYVNCSNNQLTSLEIPEGCKDVDCSGNQLTSLEVPEGCKKVDCSGNPIESLIIPKSCVIVYCCKNEFLDLDKTYIHKNTKILPIGDFSEEEIQKFHENFERREKENQNKSNNNDGLDLSSFREFER